MTKTTLGNAFDTVTMLDEIRAKSSDIRVRYWCHRNVDILLDDYQFFLEKRNEIYERYCIKDEHGKYGIIHADGRIQFNVNKEDIPEFTKELNEIISFECDVEPYILPEEVYRATVFKPESNPIDIIDYLLPNHENSIKSEEPKAKITMKEVCDAVGTLLKIRNMDIKSEISYWCFRNLNVLASDYNFYIKERNDICQRYCFEGTDGKYYTIDGEDYQYNVKEDCDVSKFDEEFNDLLNLECEIKPYVMNDEVFEHFQEIGLERSDVEMVKNLLP